MLQIQSHLSPVHVCNTCRISMHTQHYEILINLTFFWKFMFRRVDQQPRLNYFFFVGCPGRLFREDLGKICVFEKLGRKNRNRTLGWFIIIYPSNQFSNSIELWSPTTAFSRLISWEMWRLGRRGDFGSRIALWASLGYPKWGLNQNLRVFLWDVNGMDCRWNSNNSKNSMGWMLVSRKMEPFPGSCFRKFWFRFSTLYHSSRVMIF